MLTLRRAAAVSLLLLAGGAAFIVLWSSDDYEEMERQAFRAVDAGAASGFGRSA
jgi:hypothetical protein